MSNRPNPRRSAGSKAPSQVPRGVPPAGGRGMWWIIGAVAVALAVALAVAMLVTRKEETAGPPAGSIVPKGDLVYGEPTVKGAPLPRYSASGPDPAVGMPAPVVTSEQFDGTRATFPPGGTPAIVMFVAHWCPHCQKEVPLLTSYLSQNGFPQGVNLFAVATASTDQNPNYPPASWLVKEKWPVVTVADDKVGSVATAYGLSGFPFFVAVDAAGKVVARASGELTPQEFEALVQTARGAGASGSVRGGADSPR